MKVLIATKETQGRRANDFNWTNEGELVTFPTFECSRGFVDDDCGCHRSMSGTESLKATTTVQVVERDITIEDLTKRFLDMLREGKWDKISRGTELIRKAKEMAEEIIEVTEPFPPGVILERRTNFQVRN